MIPMRAMSDRQEHHWQHLRARPRWKVRLSQWIRKWLHRMGLDL